MCAINGFNFKDENLIQKMNLVTSHRGKDATGVWASDRISLGHNRLSIIDTSTNSNQPFISDNGNLILTYNGELYNYKEIKKELVSDYKFVTTGDTEVIVAAYKKWGTNAFAKFNGIFALAIWDKEKEMLCLARDSRGVKPLYYYCEDGKFIFSSEIKAILEHDIERKVNRDSLAHYLNLLYVPGPETLFLGIKKLPPGHFLKLHGQDLSIKPFTQEIKKVKSEPKDLVKKMREAVSRQLVSDRPVGLYLSGGLDSTVILEAMKRAEAKVKTFSVGFKVTKEEEEEKYNADFLLARKTAKHFDTDHHELMITSSEVINAFEKSIWHLDDPVSSATTIPMILLSKYAKEEVVVVLSGEGGDELFGGYERYKLARVIDSYRKLPKFLRNIFSLTEVGKKLDTERGVNMYERFMFQDPVTIKSIFGDNLDLSKTKKYIDERFKNFKDLSSPEYLMAIDRETWLVDEALLRSDKLSMANGVETRVPFLDNEIYDFALNLDTNEKVSFFETKKLMRRFYKGILPSYILNQPKRGFFSPGAKWLRHPEILDYAKRMLIYESVLPTNKENLEKILDEHVSGKKYHFNTIWSILTLEVWVRTFKVKFD